MYEDNDTSFSQMMKHVVQIQTWICVLYGVKQSVNIDFWYWSVIIILPLTFTSSVLCFVPSHNMLNGKQITSFLQNDLQDLI